jgi:hypothetical protein
MLSSYTVLLNRGPHKLLKMLPYGAAGVWSGETPDVVLLDGKRVQENVEKRHSDIRSLLVNPDKVHRLEKSLKNGMQDLDMPVYNFTGRGHFGDLEIEQGRHRTFMLIASYGVDFLPVLVPGSLAPKFRRLFGFRCGYLTLTEHHNVCGLKVIESQGVWHIGTDLERESVETFSSKAEAEFALKMGDWNERPTI